jgi:acyl-CoA synthetase (AMP-forming)/AMP-acid ligase II
LQWSAREDRNLLFITQSFIITTMPALFIPQPLFKTRKPIGVQGKIANWWIPDDVVIVKELPHNATGKVREAVTILPPNYIAC